MIGEVSATLADDIGCRRKRIPGIPLGRRNGKMTCGLREIDLKRRWVITRVEATPDYHPSERSGSRDTRSDD
jgi:hypothetical protein